MPSQPPSPYDRQFSFTGWSLTHPGEPHQGDKIDLELDELKQSLDETQSRLNEIQRDDGLIRPSALSSSLQAIIDQSALDAAQAVYDTNLSLLASKAAARANLELTSFFPALLGTNLVVSSADWPSGGVYQTTTQPNQWQGPFPGLLPGSTYTSRTFRASTLFGTLKDWATMSGVSGSVSPDVTPRVDNVGFALLFAGTRGVGSSNMTEVGYGWSGEDEYATAVRQLNFSSPYLPLDDEPPMTTRMPSAVNPLVTVYQLTYGLKSLWESIPIDRIPNYSQKAALDASDDPGQFNAFVTESALSAAIDAIEGGSQFSADQAAAITGSYLPSATNVMVTSSVLSSGLSGKADVLHTHSPADIFDLFGGSMNGDNLETWANAKDSEISALQTGKTDKPTYSGGFLTFTAADGNQYTVAATPV